MNGEFWVKYNATFSKDECVYIGQYLLLKGGKAKVSDVIARHFAMLGYGQGKIHKQEVVYNALELAMLDHAFPPSR